MAMTMKITLNTITVVLTLFLIEAIGQSTNCRDRSNHLRQDGGLCFEIPPWQLQPVELEQHINRLRKAWGGNGTMTRRQRNTQLVLTNSEVSRYMDTVLVPFLDTYHRNIQNAYHQLTSKILRKIKEEINAAVNKKLQIYNDLINLADQLSVPAMCEEERRQARTFASKHVAQIYTCTEEARASIAKMGKYAEEMIAITHNHMQMALGDAAKTTDLRGKTSRILKTADVTSRLQQLSQAAVALGYELDLSLTNARRHNEQSCEKLSTCSARARKRTEESVSELRDLLYQCVYA